MGMFLIAQLLEAKVRLLESYGETRFFQALRDFPQSVQVLFKIWRHYQQVIQIQEHLSLSLCGITLSISRQRRSAALVRPKGTKTK